MSRVTLVTLMPVNPVMRVRTRARALRADERPYACEASQASPGAVQIRKPALEARSWPLLRIAHPTWSRRMKGVIVSVEIGPSALTTFAEIGLLTKAEQTDVPVVRRAFHRFINWALRNAEKFARSKSHG